MVGPFLPDDEKLAAIRELLPATSAGIYLNTAEAGPLPAETAHAMAEAAEWELRTGRAHPAFLEQVPQRLDEARGALAAVLHADVDSVAIAHSAAEGLSSFVDALELHPGDRVALSRELIADVRLPGSVETVPLRGWTLPQGVRLAVVPHVTASGGMAPLADLAEAARGQGTALAVDGSLAAGAIAVDVEALGVDAYATDAHRWLLGPTGIGAIAVRGPLRDAVRSRLEAGPFHGSSVLGMARSAGWLAMYVGLDWVTTRTTELARHLAMRFSEIVGLELFAPFPPEAGIVSFRFERWPVEEAHDELGRRAFAILGLMPDGLRASVGAFNTTEELDRFADAVAVLAAHTPETLPRRPALTILHEGVS